MTMNGKYFELIQDIKAAMKVQLKTSKTTFRTVSESGKNNSRGIFKAWGNILRGISDSLPSNAIHFV